ncbi:hypothetical protein LKM01_24340 [Bacillus pacificus]|uniref:hypothetical protein n=1 Tax=Bacillus pacificus TaxID=2026187 RepID=UPI0009376823|nr:hypothetical protein [Bacillus pacificus]ASI76025.1 hypothetical protein BA202_01565 [Bacillus cereus]MCC2484927.1 hypothetical protein [Bacillus pacificus]MED1650966.1 hypothetical protein [Bacillus pacificus]
MELVLVFNLQYKDVFQKHVLLENKDVKNIIYSGYLSSQSINQIDKDVSNVKFEENSEGNFIKRIKAIAKEIIEQCKREVMGK